MLGRDLVQAPARAPRSREGDAAYPVMTPIRLELSRFDPDFARALDASWDFTRAILMPCGSWRSDDTALAHAADGVLDPRQSDECLLALAARVTGDF